MNVRRYVMEGYGEVGWRRVMVRMAPDAELADQAIAVGWYPLDTFGRLLRAVDQEFGSGNLQLLPSIGAYEAEQDFNRVLRVFMRIAHPTYVFQTAGRLWSHFQSAGRWKFEKRPGRVEGSLFEWSRDEALCTELGGYLVRLLEFAGGRDVSAKHQRCRARGDLCCTYAFRWSDEAPRG